MTVNSENEHDMQELSEREMMIAKAAAKIAIQEMKDDFYQEVGRTITQRFFIWVGLGFVAYASGKGWINLANLFK